MNNFRQELQAVLQRKKEHAGGFHYSYQAKQLATKAQETRKWSHLLRHYPIKQWRKIRRDTQFVLEELKRLGL